MKEFIVLVISLFLLYSCTDTSTPYARVASKTKIELDTVLCYNACITSLKNRESYQPRLYADPGSGYALIGYGHLIKRGEVFSTLTEPQADSLLRSDFNECLVLVQNEFPKLKRNQLYALTLFCFQYGFGFFLKSDIYKDLKQDKSPTESWMKYIRFKGKVHPKFIEAREFELKIFNCEI